jgi:citrate synthase
LHGLANQECLDWLKELVGHFGGAPTQAQIEQFTIDTLKAGKVVPGYGHAVLRKADPRFTALLEFGLKNCPNDDLVRTVDNVYAVVPKTLQAHKKDIANPWPNVDAASGALLSHYGLTETSYYTVMFGLSRAMGFCAQLIWSRAVEEPIERPKSVSLDWVEAQLAQQQAAAAPPSQP